MDQKYYGLTLLFIINLINYLDRLSIASVLSKIKEYFVLTSLEGGLLSTCFLVGYMLTAPVFGYLGDKYSRKWIMIGGIIFWSVVAFLGSVIPAGEQYKLLFFLNRVLVGVGEASYSTIAPTIIADLFEPHQRKIMLSIFYFAIPIGTGLGYVMGNLALTLGDWRWILRITPCIGIISTIMLMFLDEPERGRTDGAVCQSNESSVIADLKYLARIPSYVWSTIGFTCCLFAVGALSWWAIEYMGIAVGGPDGEKAKAYEKTATLIFGVIICVAGLVGVIIGTSSAQYLRRFDGRADPLVCAAGIFVAVPLVLFGLILARGHTGWSWFLMFAGITALSTNWAVVSDMLISVTVPNKRAFATAIQILISHVFGDATSPFIVGAIRDKLEVAMKPDDKAEYLAFMYSLLSTLVILFFGCLAFFNSSRYFVNDVQVCKETCTTLTANTSTDQQSLSQLA
ncbi:Protein spinster-like 1 [Fragariocoptes setiger]|uniref:Protein spinster-like 1 n=1 Tax=Fragariocoptes setiger TaxID=1670756 RepID=A0ABQ7S9W9_9ACAR|nr:Protein spinster-like 1 [Fragariocoptes setiger]